MSCRFLNIYKETSFAETKPANQSGWSVVWVSTKGLSRSITSLKFSLGETPRFIEAVISTVWLILPVSYVIYLA